MTEDERTCGAVVVAAGSGQRFGSGGPPKQYRLIEGRPVLAWAIEALRHHPKVKCVVAVLPPSDVDAPPPWLEKTGVLLAPGGSERRDSVRAGIRALRESGVDVALVHDGARPLLRRPLIERVIQACDGVAVVPALPVTDTLKEVRPDGSVIRTVDRGRFWSVQTPQAFPLDSLLDLHERALAEELQVTDDAALFEYYGLSVRVVRGDPENIKVTTPNDLQLAEFLARGLNAC